MGSLPVGISGSRAAAILGQSPWATPFAVWQDIMEARCPGFNKARKYDYTAFEGNASTRWGLAFEDAIIKLAEGKAGCRIADREREFIHKDFDFVTCHIDGAHKGDHIKEFLEMDNFKPRPALHEGKSTTLYGYSDKWGEPGTDRIPVEYQIQTQHQMLCTGADKVIVSVLVFPKRPEEWEALGIYPFGSMHLTKNIEAPEKGGQCIAEYNEWAQALDQMGFFHQYTIKANPELHEVMLALYKEWWEKYVIGKAPPEPQNYEDIRRLITAPVGTIVITNPIIARWFKEYKDIGAEIGATGTQAKRRDQLKVLILKEARNLNATLDDESTDKWIFRDPKGDKIGSYYRTAKGMTFR